jgi:uncharacterized protein (DUF885 family)
MRTTLAILFFVLLLTSNSPAHPAASGSSAAFDSLLDQFLDFYYPLHPSSATAAGFHQFDSKLEDFTAAGQEEVARGLKNYLAKFQALDGSKLPPDTAADLDWMIANIRGELLEIEDIQPWRKDPEVYSGTATNSIFIVMKRNFAPPEARLRSVIARERQIPKALAAARQNLQNPPKIYVEIALEQLPDEADFYRKDVPEAFSAVKDPSLLAEFKAANDAVIEAFGSYQQYLQESVLPHAGGDFRIGAENYRKKLLYDEMVDIPLDRLLEIGYADLHRNQQAMKEVAAKIDPNKPVQEVLAGIQKKHPAPDQLMQSFRDTFKGLRDFINQKKIVTIPSGPPPILEDTPPFMRATTSASMDTPGAFESKAREAFFNVTTPDSKWPADRTEQWMESFNNSMIPGTAIHEVYPGHYLQFLWINQTHSKARKLFFCGSNAEGWAHYSEQMMLDEGYGNGDPVLRMGQLEDALLRNARYIVGIQMHTGNMTLDQAKEFFIKEGYQLPPVADIETKRGTGDPTYLVYTLGKLQILKLREDYRKKRGNDFTVLDFHDKFMQQGGVPLKIIRKAMLGDDSPTL